MAVYKRSYRSYEGALTPRWSRFLILTRYAARGIFSSRILTGLFVICFFYPLVMTAGLYLNHNARVLSLLQIGPRSGRLMDINGEFFMVFMGVQGSLAFLVTALIGPNLISPDLANNALPLYFCRPLSRAEYVLGRAGVILYVLSLITWVPGLILFCIESSLSGASWGWRHFNYALGVFIGSWLWIGFLALLALALSAWVRWKLVAGASLLAVMFLTSGMTAAINVILRTTAGAYVSPALLSASVWAHFFDLRVPPEPSPGRAMLALAAMCAFCIYLLQKKIRAVEVVR